MRTLDFAPLYRGAVGFDRIVNMFENMERPDEGGYPPYNIEKADDNHYRISIAVAGFSEDDLEITAKEDTLVVRSKAQDVEDEATYLYRGIAGRAFERKFQLADHIKVVGADLTNGLLHINLEREIPEELKPRSIEIKTSDTKQLFGKAA